MNSKYLKIMGWVFVIVSLVVIGWGSGSYIFEMNDSKTYWDYVHWYAFILLLSGIILIHDNRKST
jgi:hypothetical protein